MAYRPPSAGTAQTMLLIALIFQILIAAVFLFGVGLAGIIAASVGGFGIGFLIVPVIFLVLFGLIPLFLVYVSYEWCYKRAKAGDYEGARTPTLVLTILGFIFGGVITGIFYLIGYIKLGDAVNEMRTYGAQMGGAPMYGAPMAGYAPAPGYPPQPAGAPQPAAAPAPNPAPACPRCQRPATWVPQYNRYYCYSCAQYL